MTTKLTLTVDNAVIKNAKKYARKHRISLSKMVEFYFKSMAGTTVSVPDKIPPLTRELSGMAEIFTEQTDKGLLIDALVRRHLK